MLELVKQIKEYTEAGIILNHMHLFDRLEDYFEPIRHDTIVYSKEEVEESSISDLPKFSVINDTDKLILDEIESFNESVPMEFNKILSSCIKDDDIVTVEGFYGEYGELAIWKPYVKESCTNCIYWMEDMELCSNSVVTNLYSDVEVKDNWCELWRSEDEVVSEKDYE